MLKINNHNLHFKLSSDFIVPDTIPQHDKTLTHVWQNDRGYLFNVIRSKLKSYRQGKDGIYNRDTPGVNNEGLLLLQDGAQTKVS